MRTGGLILGVFLTVGCGMPPPLITATDSTRSTQGTLIQLAPGWNCHDDRCLILDPIRRTVSLTAPGSGPVSLPEGFEIADGAVSVAEFNYLYRLARFGRPTAA